MRELRSLNFDQLCWSFGLPLDRLREIASAPAEHYRSWTESGDGKDRLITAPNTELKKALKRFHRLQLRRIPLPECAVCAPGRGVLHAAALHRVPPVLLQLDLEAFFPSIDRERVLATLRHLGCRAKIAQLLVDLLVMDVGLPQGSPTSVTVANLVLRKLDRRIRDTIPPRFTYTRYIDDLSISGGQHLWKLRSRIEERIVSEGWKIHPDKGGCFGRDEPHRMLGVLVNSQVTASPEFVVDLRRTLRAVVRGDLRCGPQDLKRLEGKVLWLQQVNARSSMRRLYAQAMDVSDDAK